jgi:hypothetical protein
MATAVPSTQSKQNLGTLPRLVRKKLQPAPLLGETSDTALDEKTYRHRLFREFVLFCRQNDAWIVSPPNQGNCRVQLAETSKLLERLAQLPRYPVVKLPGVTHRLQGGRFVEVTEAMVTLWSRG